MRPLADGLDGPSAVGRSARLRQVSRGAGGLVFGYGAVTEAQFPEGIAAVASIMVVA